MSPKLQPGCFYGKILKSCEVNGLILSESIYLPDTTLSKHSHSYSYLCIVLRGGYRETYDRRIRDCRPSTVVFHPADEVHANHFLNRGGRLFRLEIPPHWADRVSEYSSTLSSPADFNGGLLVCLVAKLYRECNQLDSVSPLVIEGLALEIVAEMSRRRYPLQRVPPRWVMQAKELLQAHFAEKLNPTAIAELLNVHPVHLARGFRQAHGCTMGEYLRQLRIEIASHHLSTSDTPLADISTLIGFADQSHFSKNFKRLTGMTPAQYRTIFRAR